MERIGLEQGRSACSGAAFPTDKLSLTQLGLERGMEVAERRFPGD
jgi:hypothetical protein